MSAIANAILDKLHGIAVQLGLLNEFMNWIKGVIEEERQEAKKDDKDGTQKK